MTLESPRDDDRRYVIVGAGAIGGTVGGVLARVGISTVLVARGRHAEILAANGLTLTTPDGIFHTPVSAVFRPEDLRLTRHDVLVFTTKTQQLDAALQEWVDQPVHGPDGVVGTAGDLLPVLTALNGVAAEEKALRYFRQVFGVCVWLPAVHLEPGEVIVRSWPVVGQFHIGRWPAPLRTPADDEFLQRLTQRVEHLGCPGERSRRRRTLEVQQATEQSRQCGGRAVRRRGRYHRSGCGAAP